MTDGQPSNVMQHLTVPNAEKLKNIGAEIFVVVVGNSAMPGIPELAKVASYPPEKHVFRVESYVSGKYVFELALKKISYNKYFAIKPFTNPC